MRIATMALATALATVLATAPAWAAARAPAAGHKAGPARHAAAAPADPARSPLGNWPARIRYLTNDAPFVVFDVAPRSLIAPGSGTDTETVTLSFIATDTLPQVHVFAFARASPSGPTRMAAGVACGPREAGYWECKVPARELLARLDAGDSDGEFGLRIEAEGLARAHSTVLVTLPMKRPRPHGLSD